LKDDEIKKKSISKIISNKINRNKKIEIKSDI
jgi:phosphotransferase system HPr-like phosphotransfer protein